ncbi:MAG: MFS transporter [Alphaproteobacteria bacterium]|nr:MFS transporter [Alphaproteobacteria bacterium]
MKAWQTPLVVLLCGTTILLVSFGTRNVYGLLMDPISVGLGWGRETFSFAVAFQSLVWGALMPVFGGIADRYGPGKIVALGGITYAGGLAMMAVADTALEALISIGVLTGFAMAAAGFGIVLSVISRCASYEKRSLYLGIASAGGSSGQLLLVPVGQWLIDDMGWVATLLIFAVLVGLIVPLAAALANGHRAGDDAGPRTQTAVEALREAQRHTGFILLTIGYFVCGFQTMFLGTHLPSFLTDAGFSTGIAADSLALIGLFNIFGCFLWGWAGGSFSKKYLLSALYFLRAIVMAVFVLLPFTETSVYVFAALIGILWLATVPLTGALVAQIFGTGYMSMLYGIAFMSHQFGSFLGIWLGGWLFDVTGSYAIVWWGGVVLGLVAALLHFPIDERPLARLSVQRP